MIWTCMEECRAHNGLQQKTYEIVEHEVVLASSSQDDSIAQIGQAPGTQEKIWKTVRRPSDMVRPLDTCCVGYSHFTSSE